MASDTRGSARAFVRSLNILLKFARLYEFGHVRTAAQFETTWKELRSALDESGGSGVLLGASGTQILLDGVPLGSAAGERSFAQLLISSGIASIHFAPTLTQPQLARFVRAFPSGNSKPTALAEQLKSALAGETSIKINEIRYVAEDSSIAGIKVAAQLTAKVGRVSDWVAEAEPEGRAESAVAVVAAVAVVLELAAPAEEAPGEPAPLEEVAVAWPWILGICGVRRNRLVAAVEPVQAPEDREGSAAAREVAEVAVREAPEDREGSAEAREVAEVAVWGAPEDREGSAEAREVAEVAVRGAPEALAAQVLALEVLVVGSQALGRSELVPRLARPESGSLRRRCCARAASPVPLRKRQVAVRVGTPCRRKTSARCSTFFRSWGNRARIPKRAWKCQPSSRA